MNKELLHQYFESICAELNNVQFTYQDKNRLYIPLFSSSIDHCISLNILKDKNITTSMYALVRPAVENYLRAMWVKYSSEFDSLKDHFPRKVEYLVDAVTQIKPELESYYFLKSAITNSACININDFTHGGMQSIARQYDEEKGELTYKRDEEEIISIQKLSVLISLLSYIEIIQDNSNAYILNSDRINEMAVYLIGLKHTKGVQPQ